jgi:hypothetical protein
MKRDLLLHNWRLSSKCAFSQKVIVLFVPSTFVPFGFFSTHTHQPGRF